MQKTGVVTSLNGNDGIVSCNHENIAFKLLGVNGNNIKNGDSVAFSVVDLGTRKIATNIQRIDQTPNISASSHAAFNSMSTSQTFGSNSLRFYLPDNVLTTRYSSFKGWDIYQSPRWEINSSSSNSIDSARDEIIDRASSLGANGLINLRYSRSTGQSGNYKYSIHHFSANPVILIKPHKNGTYSPEDLIDLEQKLEEKNLILLQNERNFLKISIAISLVLSAIGCVGFLFDELTITFIALISIAASWILYSNFDHWTIKL